MRAGRYCCVLKNVGMKMTSTSVEREGPNIKDLIYEINVLYSGLSVKIQYYE